MGDALAARRRELLALYERSPIKRTLGVTLRYEGPHAMFEMPYDPNFDNAMGGTHGGILATLLDKAGWFTVAPHYGTWVATASLHVQILKPAHQHKLFAIGCVVRTGAHLAVATMEVRNETGALIAIGSGTFAVTSKPFSQGDAP